MGFETHTHTISNTDNVQFSPSPEPVSRANRTALVSWVVQFSTGPTLIKNVTNNVPAERVCTRLPKNCTESFQSL